MISDVFALFADLIPSPEQLPMVSVPLKIDGGIFSNGTVFTGEISERIHAPGPQHITNERRCFLSTDANAGSPDLGSHGRCPRAIENFGYVENDQPPHHRGNASGCCQHSGEEGG
jgi:hypothetical protein